MGVLFVGDEVHQRDERQRDGPVEVEDVPGVFDDPFRVPYVGLDVVGDPLGAADQQRLGMAQHDRVVVGVYDLRRRRDLLHDLMEIRFGGDSRADVQELVDALGGEPRGRPVHELPVLPGRVPCLGGQLFPDGLVDRVVVLAAEQPVVDPRGVRSAGVDPGGGLGAGRHGSSIEAVSERAEYSIIVLACHLALEARESGHFAHRRRTRFELEKILPVADSRGERSGDTGIHGFCVCQVGPKAGGSVGRWRYGRVDRPEGAAHARNAWQLQLVCPRVVVARAKPHVGERPEQT